MSKFLSEIILKFSELAKDIQEWPWLHPNLDREMIIALFLGVAILVIAFGLGKSRMGAVIIGTYMAVFIELLFPYRAGVNQLLGQFLKLENEFWARSLIFLALLFLSFSVISHSLLKPRLVFKRASPFIIIFLSVVETGFLLSIFISYGALEGIGFKLPPAFADYFINKTAQFFWAVVPLASFLFLKHKRNPASL